MIYNILFSICAILYSLTGHVNSQTCSGSYPYAPCSSNSACGCVPLSFTDEIGICAVLGVSCSRLTPCRSSDQSCESPNHICVQHSQCDSRPLCYPLALIDQRLCPPSIATTTTPFMTTTTMTMNTTTTTTSSNTSLALSTYFSSLNFTSPMYFRQNETFNGTNSNGTTGHFFEAIQLVVYQSGFYNISSASPMDTFGYLYIWDFSPINITNNLIASDDDSGMERQFSIGTYLQAGYTYIVVVTTFQPNVTGQYELIVRGPQYVNFISRNYTGIETTNTTTATNTTQSNSVQSNIWWALTNTTDFLPGTNKHHHLFTLYITTSGMYNITSVSSMDTYGCLFLGGFNLTGGISGDGRCDDDGAGNGQFQILAELEAGRNYTLLFTTFGEHITGQYNIIVTGPASVYMEAQYSMMNSTSTSTWAPVFPMDVWSSYSDVLTNSSAIFNRPSGNNSSSGFFFQAFELVVNQTGFYNLTSISNFDTIGYLYEWNFYPSDPSINMVNQDDDGAGNGQFRLTHVLQAGVRYFLVATSFNAEVTGPFTVSADGPGRIDFIPLYPTGTVNTTMIPMTTTMTATMTMNMTTTMNSTTESGNMTALYFGALSLNSSSFIRPNAASTSPSYYQAVRVSVDTPGNYMIASSSSLDTIGYLYQNRFDPNYSNINLMISDDDSAGERQFALHANLQANVNYIVIVTTYNPHETGSFSLKVSGPSAARLSV